MFRFLLVEWRRFLLWCELKAANPQRSYTVTAVDEEQFIIGERMGKAERQEHQKESAERAYYFHKRREALRDFASEQERQILDARRDAELKRVRKRYEDWKRSHEE